MNKSIQQVWTFPSDSNPDVEYQTLLYVDGSASCNCKGWTRRVASDGKRSCKHTRYVDLGIADRHCAATHNYKTSERKHVEKQITKHIPSLGKRKFAV